MHSINVCITFAYHLEHCITYSLAYNILVLCKLLLYKIFFLEKDYIKCTMMNAFKWNQIGIKIQEFLWDGSLESNTGNKRRHQQPQHGKNMATSKNSVSLSLFLSWLVTFQLKNWKENILALLMTLKLGEN